MKGTSCLAYLVSFYDKMTFLVNEGKAGDAVYLLFSEAFDTVSAFSQFSHTLTVPWTGAQVAKWNSVPDSETKRLGSFFKHAEKSVTTSKELENRS